MLILFIGCTTIDKISIKKQKLGDELIGSWCLKSNVNFSSRLSFYEDSLVSLHSKIDTFSLYRYFFDENSIVLSAPNQKAIRFHVLKLEKSTMLLKVPVYSDLEIQFSRCR